MVAVTAAINVRVEGTRKSQKDSLQASSVEPLNIDGM